MDLIAGTDRIFSSLFGNVQTCVATSRMIVLSNIMDKVASRFKQQYKDIVVGDPKAQNGIETASHRW